MPRPLRPHHLLRPLALTCALVGLLLLPAAVAAAPAPVPAGFVGMNVDGPLYPATARGINLNRQLGTMAAAGVDRIRVVFPWSAAQPYAHWSQVPASQRRRFVNEGGVPTDFSAIDRIVALAARHGLTILPTVLYAPRWDVTRHDANGYGRPARPGPYAAFLRDLIGRYGPRGTFWRGHHPKLAIRQWQIWNEPELAVFWPTQPFARSYAALLKTSAIAIRRADRGAQVVLAGLTNYSWHDLALLLKVRGVSRYFDVAAIHPYTAKPGGVITILGYARDVLDQHGDRRKPLIADETGWTSSVGHSPSDQHSGFATTEQGQAKNIAALLPLLGRNRVRLGLQGFDLYTWAGNEVPNSYTFNFAGVMRYRSGKLTTKPAFGAFRHAALALEHCRRRAARAPGCAVR